jgi:hypothetical protein
LIEAKYLPSCWWGRIRNLAGEPFYSIQAKQIFTAAKTNIKQWAFEGCIFQMDRWFPIRNSETGNVITNVAATPALSLARAGFANSHYQSAIF